MLSGVAGAPTEYFDAEQADEFARAWGTTDLHGLLAELRNRKTGPNGVLGMKVHYDQMAETFGDDGLLRAFPNIRVVHIRRDDTVAQAVSYAMARQTGRWASTHVASGRAHYRRGDVDEALRQIRRDEERWTAWFATHDLDVLTVEYRELVRDPTATLALVLDHLGVTDPPRTDARPTLRRQRGLRSWLWTERYRASSPFSRAVASPRDG